MPISTPEERLATYPDGELHFAHVLGHLFAPALKISELDVIPPVVSGSDLIHADIIKNLEQADLVLCDISWLNPNVFFELGIRTALDRRVAIVKDEHTQRIPFDTGSINTHTYDSSLTPWSLETEVPKLAGHIQSCVKGTDGRNSMWRYFGLTQRASPAEIKDPTDAMLRLILSELTKLNQSSAESGEDSKATQTAAYTLARAFGEEMSHEASQEWIDAVLQNRPRLPAGLEVQLIKESGFHYGKIDAKVELAILKGFWDAIDQEVERRSP